MATSQPHPTAEATPGKAQTGNGANWLAEAITFLLSGLLCCVMLIWVLQLWRADLRVPISYGYGGPDLTFECMLAKDIIDSGWFLHNPRLGAPGEQDLRDYPMPDLVTFLPMKVMSWFTSSWGAIVNLYFFAGFLLATWSALGVFRHFGIARAPSVVASLLFAFAPYHFYRGEWHLHLSAYFVIPLAGMLLLWVMSGERLFAVARRGRLWVLPVPSRKGVAAIAACALLGSDGAYYAFFTIVLLMGAAVFRAFEGRSFRRAGVAAMLAGAIALALVLNLFPDIIHILVDGKNPEVAVRAPYSAELYALKLTQMVLPVAGHRIPQLAAFRAAYDRTQPAINEADAAALGAFGAAGFCFLLLSLVTGYPWHRHRVLIHHLSLLNLCAFLVGTLGGIGSLLAWTIWSQIRAYNRISIFIGFFSAMAVAAVLDEIWRRWARTVLRQWMCGAVLAGFLAAGLLDQTTPAGVPSYKAFTAQYHSDADFAAQAERWLPHDSMVLQLPFMAFPEVPPPGSMRDYDPFMPYLHSTTLRWSYGAVKGRYWDAWQARMSSLPVEEIVDTAAEAGFGAIYIDRNGYADRGAAIGSHLGVLGLSRIESRNGRFWLYNIGPYATRMRAEFTPADWAGMREIVLYHLVLQWLPECSGMEGDARQNWHWCGSQGGFLLENPSVQAKRLEIHGTVAAATAGACSLRVDGPGWAETLPLKGGLRQPLAHSLEVPPGSSFIRFRSNCRRLLSATDPRPLVFRIDNFNAALEDAAPEPAWNGGFYGLEKDGSRTWHWCSSSGELIIRNPGPARETTMRMIVASSQAKTSPLSIAGPGFAESMTIGPAGAAFSKRFLVPQGNSVIRFSSPAAPLIPPNDPRKLVFRVEDLQLGNPLLTPTIIFK
jgi:phosphoglycerol transferase